MCVLAELWRTSGLHLATQTQTNIKTCAQALARRQLVELKNGRLAMLATSGMLHHYFLTGKGPIQFITQIPNFKSCAAAAVDTGLCK